MELIQPARDDLKVPGTAPLWRYMKLSAFLRLIRGYVFVPSLDTLAADDPKEAFLLLESPSRDDLCAYIAENNLL